MQQVRLGNTGLKVSRLCLGCMTYGSKDWRSWVLDMEESKPFFQTAIEKGITFFDTANVYSVGVSEEVTGRWLREFARREEIVVATKVNGPMGPGPNEKGLSRKSILAQIDASLKRLGMDYVDLYQIHRWDDRVPIEETLEALHDVVKSGKVRYIGASSMYAWQFATALQVSARHGWTRFVSMQKHVNLLYREEEREMLPLCRAEGIGVIPWSPLARGRLTRDWNEHTYREETDEAGRKFYAGVAEADRAVVDAVGQVAKARGVPRAQVGLAWLLQQPGITAPIIGASRDGHLEDAVAAVALNLTPEECATLESPYVPHPIAGPI